MLTRASVILGLMASAGPAFAHAGAHLHPHDGAHWMVLASALAVLAVAAGVVIARARAGQ